MLVNRKESHFFLLSLHNYPNLVMHYFVHFSHWTLQVRFLRRSGADILKRRTFSCFCLLRIPFCRFKIFLESSPGKVITYSFAAGLAIIKEKGDRIPHLYYNSCILSSRHSSTSQICRISLKRIWIWGSNGKNYFCLSCQKKNWTGNFLWACCWIFRG